MVIAERRKCSIESIKLQLTSYDSRLDRREMYLALLVSYLELMKIAIESFLDLLLNLNFNIKN